MQPLRTCVFISKPALGGQASIFFTVFPLCLYSSVISSSVLCACMGYALLGCICAYQKLYSLNHSLKVPVGLESSWKICLFCLLVLLFLVSEYCASRKKSLNCWSRAFFQSLPRIKWLNKKAHRFYSLGGGEKKGISHLEWDWKLL